MGNGHIGVCYYGGPFNPHALDSQGVYALKKLYAETCTAAPKEIAISILRRVYFRSNGEPSLGMDEAHGANVPGLAEKLIHALSGVEAAMEVS